MRVFTLAALTLACAQVVALPRHAGAQRPSTRGGTDRRPERIPPLRVDSTCHFGLLPLPRSGTELLVDVVLRDDRDTTGTVPREADAGGPRLGPTPEQVAAVEALGARVVYRFVLPGVRVRVAADRLPALARIATDLVVVREPRRHDVEVVVTYPTWPDESPNGNREILAREREWKRTLGGYIAEPLAESRSYIGVLPDRGLRRLLASRRGMRARWSPIGCLAPSYELPP